MRGPQVFAAVRDAVSSKAILLQLVTLDIGLEVTKPHRVSTLIIGEVV